MAEALVTGGAGFIGSHLVDGLVARGRRTIVLDDLSTGHRSNLPDDDMVTFVHGDVRDPRVLAHIGREHDVDVVFHLAAIASVSRSVENPIETLSVNLEGSLRLALWAEEALPSLRRFVFASSAAVYGSDVPVPVAEPVHGVPDSPYGLEKATVERYLRWLHATRGFPAVAARFFNVYGPRQDPSSPYSGVLSILTDAARAGRAFTVDGDGEQTRDFVYVLDVVDALLVLELDAAAPGNVFNVGTGFETSINEIVATVRELTGGALNVRHGTPRTSDIRRSAADVGRIRAIGWKPTWSLRDGLGTLTGA